MKGQWMTLLVIVVLAIIATIIILAYIAHSNHVLSSSGLVKVKVV